MLYFCDHITNFSEFEDKIITNINFFIFEFHQTRQSFIALSSSFHYTSLEQVHAFSSMATYRVACANFTNTHTSLPTISP